MSELESIIEEKLIAQLTAGKSQWNYRDDLKTEADLWANFKYILEQNNKSVLDDTELSEQEFEQVKNQVTFPSFYRAGQWLVGENGRVFVHVQRGNETLHLCVMNHEHLAGGTSVYEVVRQYQTLKQTDEEERKRRFDVTLLINGLPMIHIELKNRDHSYLDGFWQIKNYIKEGQFRGIYSAVQLFVVSNAVETKYFPAGSDIELKKNFLSGWVDENNKPVGDYLAFAEQVLKIPMAHEMIAKYTVLDDDRKRLITLRPYQIHAIEAIREASRHGQSGFIWHTTGSGKTLTSYKATRNLLMDIPSIDKTIFLIDREDLDTQTSLDFQSYAKFDTIDVDDTEFVDSLLKKLINGKRQLIVTTRQKLNILLKRRMEGKEETKEYKKLKSLKLAFVVDECHRAISPRMKKIFSDFFPNSLWYGFTGTPRFSENAYPQLGDLPRTTEELYGPILHQYTIKEAVHDRAVLGFMIENLGPNYVVTEEQETEIYESDEHMLRVIDTIINKSEKRFGFANGKGKTYEAILTTSSIPRAQRYYQLFKRVKNGEMSVKIDEKIKRVLPDFPKVAITYSIQENTSETSVNEEKMSEALNDYSEMFNLTSKFTIDNINGYNKSLNKRLARKQEKYKNRAEQLDIVIVVNRLLTGFDAPALSTVFIDRPPMQPHEIIQTFSRSNRIFDENKTDGQIVTFQSPNAFKEAIDDALRLYTAGTSATLIAPDWDVIKNNFETALQQLREIAPTPADTIELSNKERRMFLKIFQRFDRAFGQIQAFSTYDPKMLEEYPFTMEEYDDYAAHYQNILEEIRKNDPDDDESVDDGEGEEGGIDEPFDFEYDLISHGTVKIDYEYILNLIQDIVDGDDDESEEIEAGRIKKILQIKEHIDEMSKDNPQLACLLEQLFDDIIANSEKYKNVQVSMILEQMRIEAIHQMLVDFSKKWFVEYEAVQFAVDRFRGEEIPNKKALVDAANYASYKESTDNALSKFSYQSSLKKELLELIVNEIVPLRRD